jgi:anti-anti-sigma regulatory factor
MSHVRSWLQALPSFSDPIKQKQAPLVQGMLLCLILLSLIGIPLNLMTQFATPGAKLFTIAITFLMLAVYVCSFFALRRGQFSFTIALISFSLSICTGLLLVPRGLNSSWITIFLFTYPITFAGLLAPRIIVWATSISTVLIITLIGLLGSATPNLVGYDAPGAAFSAEIVYSYAILALILTACFDQFGSALRQAVVVGRQRELELESVRAYQETLIADRTNELRTALAAVEHREQELSRTLAELHKSQEVVRELSAPVMPVLPGVLVAPMVGVIDTERAEALTHNTLRAVENERAGHVIFDITGVPVVDTHVAQVLIQTASAARLLGAEVLLVGVRPEVAQTMVSLGIDLQGFATYANLRSAVATLLREHGWARAIEK